MTHALKPVDPAAAARLIEGGAVLVDIREADERRRIRIPGSRHLPLSGLDARPLEADAGRPVIYHCASGARTHTHGGRLAAKASGRPVYVLAGGISSWLAAGLPVADGPG